MSPMIFMQIGWMKDYRGWRDDDRIIGGGKWPAEHGGRGGELCNFATADDGFVYGHVETSQDRSTGEIDRNINLSALGGKGESAQPVDVIWTAYHPTAKKTCIVGWYRDAIVMHSRVRKTPPSRLHRANETGSWRVRTQAINAFCIPPDERVFFVKRGKGWLGQTQWKVFPARRDAETDQFLSDVRRLISFVADPLDQANKVEKQASPFDSKNDRDARIRVEASITVRQGQGAFRNAILAAYNRRCAITGNSIEAVLEAAHIMPYRGSHTDHVQNGILLRADMHTLLDRRLLGIDARGRIHVKQAVRTVYAETGWSFPASVTMPARPADHPSQDALASEFEEFLARNDRTD